MAADLTDTRIVRKGATRVRGNHSVNCLDEERLLSVGEGARYFNRVKAVPTLKILELGTLHETEAQ